MDYSRDKRIQEDYNKSFDSNKSDQISNISTPLSINKTQSNFNQQDLLNFQYFPNHSPLSLTQKRYMKKSITPYPMWYTAQDCRNRKEDSLIITDYQENKENINEGVNTLQRWGNQQYESKSPHNFKRALQDHQKSTTKNNKSIDLSNNSKNLIKQSIKKAIQCSNNKKTVNLTDVMSIDSGSDVFGSLSRSSKNSKQQTRYHINIQQSSSPSNIQSQRQTIDMIPMILSKKPQSQYNQDQYQHSQNKSLSQDNQIIEYFLTEQDSQTQYNISNDDNNILNELKQQLYLILEDNTTKMENKISGKDKPLIKNDKKLQTIEVQSNKDTQKLFKKQSNHINFCDILQNKLKQLSNNIAILHQKVNNTQQQSIFSNSKIDQNIKHSTMESLDSRPDDISTNSHKPISSIQLELKKKQNHQNKLIYHDSKIIFSRNDSGFVQFSEEFSQILNDTQSQILIQQNQSKYSNSRKVIFQNSPVSIDISEQLNNVLQNHCGKSQKGSQMSNKTQNQRQNSQQNQNISHKNQSFYLQNQSYFNNNDQSMDSKTSSNQKILEKQPFRLSFPKILTENQWQLSQSGIYNSSPKIKQGQSFISQSSNQPFMQNQINKKFNNKFNQWLLMS